MCTVKEDLKSQGVLKVFSWLGKVMDINQSHGHVFGEYIFFLNVSGLLLLFLRE